MSSFRVAACLVGLIASAELSAQDSMLEMCTLAGCSSAVYIPVRGLPSPLPSGSYRVEAFLDGQLIACEATAVVGNEAVSCASEPRAPWVQLRLGPQEHTITIGSAAPRHLKVRLLRSGEQLSVLEIDPGPYRVRQPNGPECGPICLFAGPFYLVVQ